jgi:hypothetical protein
MDFVTRLLIMFYEGKTPNSPDVQLRAPIDIFEAIKIIKVLQAAQQAAVADPPTAPASGAPEIKPAGS